MCQHCDLISKAWDEFAVEHLRPELDNEKVRLIKLYWTYGGLSVIGKLIDHANACIQAKDLAKMVPALGAAQMELVQTLQENGKWLSENVIPRLPPHGRPQP
jgi:hypothetical protein